MSCYISSNENRLYAAQESAYGQVAAITAANRIAAIKLSTKQELETAERPDKTGSRTFAGFPADLRRLTSFDLATYMTSWDNPSARPPSYGPLFRASMGGAPLVFCVGAVSRRCSSRPKDDRDQQRLSPVRVKRPGAGLDRERVLRHRGGTALDLYLGAADGAVQLFDHSRTPATSLAGGRTGSFLHRYQR